MEWKDLEKELVKCIKCGACQSVCPIFKELQSESSVARGKIGLMKAALKGNVEPTAEFVEKMALCTGCKACSANCPSGTKVDQLVLHARQKLVAVRGLPLAKRIALRLVLKHRKLFDAGMKMGSVFQGLVLKEVKGKGALPRLPMGLNLKRLLTPVAAKPLRDRYPERVEVDEPRATVVFFTGCTINYMYPEIGEAVIEVLKKNNINVIIPATQHCCGLAAYGNGDATTAVELARATVDVCSVENADAIITACGSCGSALRMEYRELLKNEPGYPEKVAEFSKKCVDFSEFMVKLGLQGKLNPVNRTVTYHESCHLTRGQGIKSQPRQLLQSIPGIILKEMKEPGKCCGMAGSFSLTHYDLSRKINQRKIEDIASTGADTLVTGCSGCIMHIRDGIYQNGLKIEVVNVAQLLAESYK
jgi:glycolate oxidase iron-sulfur subunit